ncbi:unnamed protein product, partial [marine sediment metagenome]
EERHSSHMTRLAGFVVELTAQGKFDDLMGEVTW